MLANELREKFLEYFKEKGHKVIPSASLVPENDPTALFTSAGMQPLVPYLLGEKHPMGNRIADAQKCIRTDDIDEVGDKVHHTFFEMLGNWSLGNHVKPDGHGAGYFKKEAIEWSFEFLTGKNWLGLDKERLAMSVFAGDNDAPFDQEAYDKWVEIGIQPDRIAKLPKKNNWWGPGESGPCGPDTEMFYWTGSLPAPDKFDDKNAAWVEIWNDVFMQYSLKDGVYTPLIQKNVDTGMGLERMLAVINGFDDNYKTDLFLPIIKKIEELSGKTYEGNEKEFRIIADHVKAAVFAISDGVIPSNKGAGYVVRRLIRRSIVKANQLGIKDNFTAELANIVFGIYEGIYFDAVIPAEAGIQENTTLDPRAPLSSRTAGPEDDKGSRKIGIVAELEKEEVKFKKTLREGLKIIAEQKEVSGKILFDLYQSFGLPLEISTEEFKSRGIEINNSTIQQFNDELKAHQELSRTASAGMFKGGLAESGEMATKYHTASHLLLSALQKIVDPNIIQKGSNITAERLRLDFNSSEKLTPEQIKEIEDLVNEQIKKDLPVLLEEMTLTEAKNSGAKGIFDSKYGERVKVYTIGPSIDCPSTPSGHSGPREFFSREICGGPHVSNTSELGHFSIIKEESSGAGIRRIKAVLK